MYNSKTFINKIMIRFARLNDFKEIKHTLLY